MMVLKTCGKIFGAQLTAAEKKALDIEINKAIAESLDKLFADIDATYLWALHETAGFGLKRLHDVYMAYAPAIKDLCKRYELDAEEDRCWLCRRMLQDMGVDLEAWHREAEEILAEREETT